MENKKVVLFSDQHYHSFRQFSKPADLKVDWQNNPILVSSRLLDIHKSTQAVLKAAIRLGCPIVSAGDWFEEKGRIGVDAMALATLDAASIGNSCGLYITHGNHDISPSGFYSIDHFRYLPGVSVVHSGIVTTKSGVTVEFCGFRPDFDPDQHVLKSGADMLVLHNTPTGAKEGEYYEGEGFDPNHSAFDSYKVVVCGHIHQKQKIGKVQVLGSHIQHRSSDIGDRGYWVYDNGEVEFFPLNNPKFVTLSDPTEEHLKDMLSKGHRVTVHGASPVGGMLGDFRVVAPALDLKEEVIDEDPVLAYVKKNPPDGISQERIVDSLLGYIK